MRCSEAEDAGGLTPVKDDNEAAPHFCRRTLLFFNCFDYNAASAAETRFPRILPQNPLRLFGLYGILKDINNF